MGTKANAIGEMIPYNYYTQKNNKMDMLDMTVAEARRLGMKYGEFVAFAEKSAGSLRNYFKADQDLTVTAPHNFRRRTVERFCVICGDQIDPVTRRIRYCSEECQEEGQRREEAIDKMKERECAVCKKVFKPRTYNAKCCSIECRELFRRDYPNRRKLNKSGSDQ